MTTLHAQDLDAVEAAFGRTLQPLSKACLRPEVQTLEDFARDLAGLWRRQRRCPCVGVGVPWPSSGDPTPYTLHPKP